MKKLLNKGVKIDILDEKGNLALYYAVKKNHAEIAKIILDNMKEHSLTISLHNKRGKT